MRRVLSVLVENEPGVLSRVAGLFSGRGFNIESLNVAPTLEDGVSLMTITTSGDEQIIEQIVKQLRKLVTVVKVVDFYGMAYVEREMMVIKVHAEESKRGEVLRIADIFRCKVVDVSLTDLTLEATGDHSKLQAIIQLLQKFGIKELARTGTLAVRRTMQSDDIYNGFERGPQKFSRAASFLAFIFRNVVSGFENSRSRLDFPLFPYIRYVFMESGILPVSVLLCILSFRAIRF